MASVFTPNLAVEEPGAGDYVGTWNVPVNQSMVTLDSALGTAQSINLGGGSVTLSTAQTRSANLLFSGSLPSNVTVTIPSLSSAPGTTISGRFFTVQNQCSNSSAFTLSLASTVAGQQSICLPPYEPCDVILDGTNSSQAGSVKFRNLGRVGTYWDYAGSSVPAWVTGCTVPPYLNCDGTAFSSATYPALATILGSTTLPDGRGRTRFALNQGTGRITAITGSINGEVNYSTGGSQSVALSSQNMPPILITDPGHSHTLPSAAVKLTAPLQIQVGGAAAYGFGDPFSGITATSSATTGITAGSTSPTVVTTVPPGYIGGLTLIRAA